MLNLNLKDMKQLTILKLIGLILIFSVFTISCEQDRESDDLASSENGQKDIKVSDIAMDLVEGQFTAAGEVTAEIVGT